MLVIRPIQDTDYDALYQCAEASGHGFTSLPVNQELLSKRIEASISSFSKHTEHPQNESYLMVAVDTRYQPSCRRQLVLRHRLGGKSRRIVTILVKWYTAPIN